jgi:uncharacterized membrane protein
MKLIASREKPAASSLLVIIGLFLILFNLFHFYRGNLWATAILFVGFLIARVFFYEVNWPIQLQDSDWLSASFFAFDEWTPNFFEFVINGLFVGFGVQFLLAILKKSTSTAINLLIWCGPILFWLWINGQLAMVLEHSHIPVNFEHIFELRLSSFVFFTLLGFFFYQFQLILLQALQVQFGKQSKKHKNKS